MVLANPTQNALICTQGSNASKILITWHTVAAYTTASSPHPLWPTMRSYASKGTIHAHPIRTHPQHWLRGIQSLHTQQHLHHTHYDPQCTHMHPKERYVHTRCAHIQTLITWNTVNAYTTASSPHLLRASAAASPWCTRFPYALSRGASESRLWVPFLDAMQTPVCACVCVCVCVCMCVNVSVCVSVYVYICACLYKCESACLCIL